MKVTVFYDTKDQSVEVYKANKSDRIARIENLRTPNAAKAALKRRGFSIEADSEDDYPYGTRWDGTSTR